MTLLFGASLLGCQAGTGTTAAIPRPAAACLMTTGEPDPSLSIALADAPNPRTAPIAGNRSERLLFRQLYETLVQGDCEGRVVPGLAEAWSTSEAGRVWRFRLRDDATFWDGAPVTAAAVVQSWAAATPTVIAELTALGQRDLRVDLAAPVSDAHFFAHPDLAVSRRSADAVWPMGSGPYRIEPNADARVVRIRSRNSRLPQTIDFRVIEGADPRRPLDLGVDALVSTDARVLEYARALPAYTVTPLLWTRTYVIVTHRSPSPLDSARHPSPAAVQAFSRDAVRADIRPAEPPFWWQDRDCRPGLPSSSAAVTASGGIPVVVYPRSDAIARDIAERLVALAWPPTRAPAWLESVMPVEYRTLNTAPSARALDERALLESLRTNAALAFVIALPRATAGSCASIERLDPFARAIRSLTALHISPLLDARDYVIQRRNLGNLIVDGDGTIRFTGARP